MAAARLAGYATLWLLACGLSGLAGERHAVPLNDYTRLGQRFTVSQAFSALSVVVPSWLDAEGGLTLTLWSSPGREQRLADRVFTDIPDNASVWLYPTQPQLRGSYYWEVDARTGTTRVGLYADALDEATEDCACFDGTPDPKQRFVFSTVPAPLLAADVPRLLADLKPEAPPADRADACRQLAVLGHREAVAALADLLADATFSHLARYALEPMPDRAVDKLLRQSLDRLTGERLVGVINSIAVRRDPDAVRPLAKRLRDPDAEVAAAAAVALGRIGTAAAAKALTKALATAGPAARPGLCEAQLDCAQRLAEQGSTSKALTLFDQLRAADTPAAIRQGAIRGAIAWRQARVAVPLLIEQLRGPDEAGLRAALWLVHRELTGASVTRALAAELTSLPADRRLLLARALCCRGDPEALPVLADLARQQQDKALRLAVIQGLPGIRDATAPAVLLDTTLDPDAEIAKAARLALDSLRPEQVTPAIAARLTSSNHEARVSAIRLAADLRLQATLPGLLAVARDPSPEVRQPGIEAVEKLAGPDEVPALLELLTAATDPQELAALERAVAAACGRGTNPESTVETVVGLLPTARPTLRQSLLRLLQRLGGSRACWVVAAATADADADVRTTALRLLTEWKTVEAAPDLLTLARTATEPDTRLLCLRQCLRLASQAEAPAETRLGLCQQAAPLIQRDDERRLLLAALASLALPAALELVTPHLASAPVRDEASAAVLAIAGNLAQGQDGPKAIPALEKVVQSSPGTDQANRAQALIEQLRSRAGAK